MLTGEKENMTQAIAPSMTPQQQDELATRAILARAIERTQLVTTQTIAPANNPVVNIPLLNVGLVKRLLLVGSCTITNTGSTTVTLTEQGLANIFGQNGIQYADLNNFLRISTSGQHIAMVANAKRRHPMGGTYQSNTLTGSNRSQLMNLPPATWGVYSAPATIASGGSATVRFAFEIPLAYSDDNLKGAVWANVLSAVHSLTLTFNAQAVTADPLDNSFAVYSGAAGSAGAISTATFSVYQNYFDNLPMVNGQYIRPELSLATVYELKSTVFKGVSANQEFQIPYANQRSFISTFLLYNNDGTSAGKVYGTDMGYLALQASNSSYIWKLDPLTVALASREHLKGDLPAGTYYMPSRKRNLATAQYGNLQLTINPTSAGANAQVIAMWEDFALLQAISNGPSLPSS
jgi:hypothetical protein